ncbi:hypothetical protein ACVW0Y_003442 [Pseudomonas sp. TE3786]
MLLSPEPIQPIRLLLHSLYQLAGPERYLFTPDDLRGLLPELSEGAYKTLLSRADSGGLLTRVCRGLYVFEPAAPRNGLLLAHAAARLRANYFNYLSLETALSDAGVISQVPMNWLTLMSSGRSSQIDCGRWGTIEFVHTRQQPNELAEQLNYDARCRLWRATTQQALRDMRATRRSMDLVAPERMDGSSADEPV